MAENLVFGALPLVSWEYQIFQNLYIFYNILQISLPI